MDAIRSVQKPVYFPETNTRKESEKQFHTLSVAVIHYQHYYYHSCQCLSHCINNHDSNRLTMVPRDKRFSTLDSVAKYDGHRVQESSRQTCSTLRPCRFPIETVMLTGLSNMSAIKFMYLSKLPAFLKYCEVAKTTQNDCDNRRDECL